MIGPRLVLEGIACLRGDRLLFEDLSLVMEAGGAALVTGRNGVGKSSLLRIAAGLLPASAGAVTRRGAIALAGEAAALDERQPLGAALAFWAGLDGRDADAVAQACVAMGIAHLAPVPVRMLSTGQRKRAALARTIAGGADIWLLDEPANGLDGEGQALLETAIAAHRHSGGIAIVASHQPVALPDARVIAL